MQASVVFHLNAYAALRLRGGEASATRQRAARVTIELRDLMAVSFHRQDNPGTCPKVPGAIAMRRNPAMVIFADGLLGRVES
jgi:deoxyinosine 3'endonuclease (endonuclease V)